MNEQSPFIPGARVAISSGYRDNLYEEAFVEKAYKNGNFILRGDTSRQQWKPWSMSRGDGKPPTWTAHKTNDSWSRRSVILWDESTDAEIAAGIALRQRHSRLQKIQDRVRYLSAEQVTDDMLAAFETALPPRMPKAEP